jgi:hypothetical protein
MPKPKPTTASTIPIHCSYARLADVTSLVANPRNPNKHSDKQVALLAKVIRHQGWRAPITVSKRSGFIVTGHGRLAAALLLQVEQVPIDEQDFASEADEWAHLVADNRIAELSENDNAMMKELLSELDGSEFDMDFTGFTGKEVNFWLDEDTVIGGGEQGETPKDQIEDYEQSTVRQIMLIMDVEEFEEIMAKIEAIKKEHKLENNTTAALTAIREYANHCH